MRAAALLRSASASYNASQKLHRFHHPAPGHVGLAIAAWHQPVRSVFGTHPRGSPDGIPAVLYRV